MVPTYAPNLWSFWTFVMVASAPSEHKCLFLPQTLALGRITLLDGSAKVAGPPSG